MPLDTFLLVIVLGKLSIETLGEPHQPLSFNPAFQYPENEVLVDRVTP
jgi:hypothetical protein